MTPILTLIFGVAPTIAVGTDLEFAALTQRYWNRCTPSPRECEVGHYWTSMRRQSYHCHRLNLSSKTTRTYFERLGASYYLFNRHLSSIDRTFTDRQSQNFRVGQKNPKRMPHGVGLKIATVLIGGAIGVLVTISSIGAGAIGTTLILMLYPHLKTAEVAGTDITYAVPLTALAGGRPLVAR